MTEPSSSPPDRAPPRAGASIAVFNGRSVLLVKRAEAPFAGLWSLPGGKTEPGEEPRETACRELKEETGIEAHVEGVIDIVEIADENETEPGRYRLTVFFGSWAAGNLEAAGDAASAAWVGLEDVEDLPMTEGTRALIWLGAHRLRRP